MLFHGLIKCTFACQKVCMVYTILYTQYDVMHVHCLSMHATYIVPGQVGLKHVHGIFFVIDHVFVMLGMCRICALVLKKQCPQLF
jgi:hypothetical protein